MGVLSRTKGRWLPVAVLASIGALLTAGVAAADPPGNNGTVKIDGLPFAQHVNNEPHVGCTFNVDWWGFDEGDLVSKVKFTVYPPTGKFIVILTDQVQIGEDPAGGGTDLDAVKLYDLTDELLFFMGHPEQGFHVKLTINAPGSIGKDTKYKTFWVSGCGGY